MYMAEVRRLKQGLGEIIADEVTSFSKETGLLVSSIDMARTDFRNIVGNLLVEGVHYDVAVRVEVRSWHARYFTGVSPNGG